MLRTAAAVAVIVALAIGGTAMPECNGAEPNDETYVPDKARAGGEAQGRELPESSLKIYIPQSLGEGERARALYQYLFTQPADSAIWRDFAERSGFVIGPELDSRERRANVGARLGHPELENLPVTYIGHSGGGPAAWQKAVAPENIARSLAVIGHHSLAPRVALAGKLSWEHPEQLVVELRPDVAEGDPRGAVPVWNIAGARDKHQVLTPLNLLVSAKGSAVGWRWSCVLGHGECHQGNDFEAMKLQTMWLEDVAALRIRDQVGADGTVSLHDIADEGSWVGYLEVLPPNWGDGGFTAWRVARADVYPYVQAPGKGAVEFEDGRVGGYVWLPSERVARAWLNYHRTSRISGEDTPRLQVDIWPALTDTPDERLGWNLFANDWCHVYFSMLNIPGFQGDPENVRWEVLSGLPGGLSVPPNGRIQTDAIGVGVYKLRLRATYGGQSWQDDYYLGLRASENDSPLKLTVASPEPGAAVTQPFQIHWTSTLPLGLLQWHSSVDGDLGTEFGDLGAEGSLAASGMSEGSHLITVLAYSAAPATQRQAVSFLVDVRDGAE